MKQLFLYFSRLHRVPVLLTVTRVGDRHERTSSNIPNLPSLRRRWWPWWWHTQEGKNGCAVRIGSENVTRPDQVVVTAPGKHRSQGVAYSRYLTAEVIKICHIATSHVNGSWLPELSVANEICSNEMLTRMAGPCTELIQEGREPLT